MEEPEESMGTRRFVCWVRLVAAVVLSGLPANGLTQEQEILEAGKREFQRSCATCHGIAANGNGPSANALNVQPADLTQMSKKHGGTFLFWRTYEKISGRDEDIIRGHGTREMPIWGERFRAEPDADSAYNMGVRGRILSLVHYLQSIQER